jgi:hypothetical protein
MGATFFLDSKSVFSATPKSVGLYNPDFEHDACGVAMVATLKKIRSHEIVVALQELSPIVVMAPGY